tara:strand:- start:160 stop:798 length:639 start_codon:yes stop_codon:yes gene_type:complete
MKGPREDLNLALKAISADVGPIKMDSDTKQWSYASLKALVAAIKPGLAKHGLVCSHHSASEYRGDAVVYVVTTTITHIESGETISTHGSSVMDRPSSDQEYGKKSTYWRRYNLQLLLNLTFDKDMDDTDGMTGPGDVVVEKAPEPIPEMELLLASVIRKVEGASDTTELAKLHTQCKAKYQALDKVYQDRYSATASYLKSKLPEADANAAVD